MPVYHTEPRLIRLKKVLGKYVEGYKSLISVNCPYCGRVHYHAPVSGPRLADCVTDTKLLEDKGYDIEIEKETPTY